jgi:hypothetical protein
MCNAKLLEFGIVIQVCCFVMNTFLALIICPWIIGSMNDQCVMICLRSCNVRPLHTYGKGAMGMM